MRSVLRATGLVGLIMVAMGGCEEMMEEPKAQPASRPTALYREIGADELLERWSLLPGGAVAIEASTSARRERERRAAATDGFDVLPPRFRFSDAREYGACSVFTAKAEAIPGAGAWYGTMHVIDCVGNRHEENTVEGLFHTALGCIPTAADASERYSTWHIIRAGDFDPTTHPHLRWVDSDFPNLSAVQGEVSVSPTGKSRSSDLYQWSKYLGEVLINWAMEFHAEYHREVDPYGRVSSEYTVAKIELFPFDHLESSEELRFKVDHSKGVVDVEPNDGAAFTEYRSRCESLPPDPIL